MKPDAAQREAVLFEAAAKLSGRERVTFLDGACHGDPALRARLETLLAAHEPAEATSALGEGAGTQSASPPPLVARFAATWHNSRDAIFRMTSRRSWQEPLAMIRAINM